MEEPRSSPPTIHGVASLKSLLQACIKGHPDGQRGAAEGTIQVQQHPAHQPRNKVAPTTSAHAEPSASKQHSPPQALSPNSKLAHSSALFSPASPSAASSAPSSPKPQSRSNSSIGGPGPSPTPQPLTLRIPSGASAGAGAAVPGLVLTAAKGAATAAGPGSLGRSSRPSPLKVAFPVWEDNVLSQICDSRLLACDDGGLGNSQHVNSQQAAAGPRVPSFGRASATGPPTPWTASAHAPELTCESLRASRALAINIARRQAVWAASGVRSSAPALGRSAGLAGAPMGLNLIRRSLTTSSGGSAGLARSGSMRSSGASSGSSGWSSHSSRSSASSSASAPVLVDQLLHASSVVGQGGGGAACVVQRVQRTSAPGCVQGSPQYRAAYTQSAPQLGLSPDAASYLNSLYGPSTSPGKQGPSRLILSSFPHSRSSRPELEVLHEHEDEHEGEDSDGPDIEGPCWVSEPLPHGGRAGPRSWGAKPEQGRPGLGEGALLFETHSEGEEGESEAAAEEEEEGSGEEESGSSRRLLQLRQGGSEDGQQDWSKELQKSMGSGTTTPSCGLEFRRRSRDSQGYGRVGRGSGESSRQQRLSLEVTLHENLGGRALAGVLDLLQACSEEAA